MKYGSGGFSSSASASPPAPASSASNAEPSPTRTPSIKTVPGTVFHRLNFETV
jgi:hypothetical protein